MEKKIIEILNEFGSKIYLNGGKLVINKSHKNYYARKIMKLIEKDCVRFRWVEFIFGFVLAVFLIIVLLIFLGKYV